MYLICIAKLYLLTKVCAIRYQGQFLLQVSKQARFELYNIDITRLYIYVRVLYYDIRTNTKMYTYTVK